MSKNKHTVYKSTNTTVSPDGELIKIEKWHREAETIHEFVKLMIDEVEKLYNLSTGEYQVLFAAIKHIRYESTFIATKEFRERVAILTNKKPNSVATILSSLVDKGMIYRMSKGYYELNPKIFWKGDEVERMKRVEYHKIIEQKTRYGN